MNGENSEKYPDITDPTPVITNANGAPKYGIPNADRFAKESTPVQIKVITTNPLNTLPNKRAPIESGTVNNDNKLIGPINANGWKNPLNHEKKPDLYQAYPIHINELKTDIINGNTG